MENYENIVALDDILLKWSSYEIRTAQYGTSILSILIQHIYILFCTGKYYVENDTKNRKNKNEAYKICNLYLLKYSAYNKQDKNQITVNSNKNGKIHIVALLFYCLKKISHTYMKYLLYIQSNFKI